MKTRTARKAAMMQKNANEKSMVLLSLVSPTALDRSKMMNPTPPREKRKLEASPSIMYCPFTLYCIKATGRGLPNSSAGRERETGRQKIFSESG